MHTPLRYMHTQGMDIRTPYTPRTRVAVSQSGLHSQSGNSTSETGNDAKTI
jgi:hypothetical protein